MRAKPSRQQPATLFTIGIVIALAGVLGIRVALHAASAQVQVDGQTFALAARLCPDGYEGASYAEECTEPIAGFSFDVAGPVNTEATTGDDGRVAVGTAEEGIYFVEALEFDRDVGFTVLCERAIGDYALPVDLEYTDAGFEVDLEAEFAREIPDDLDPQNGATCTWYSTPGVPAADPDERPGIVHALSLRCPDIDEASVIVALSPGEDATDLAPLAADCDRSVATLTLTNEESETETPVEAIADPEITFTSANVEAGSYTATGGESDPSAPFAVDAGEATLLIAISAPMELQATLRPGPTVEPEPTIEPTVQAEPTTVPEPPAAPVALAALQFGSGDWQDAFPNINTGVYDRSAVAVYGQFSPFPTASLRFDLPTAPTAGATLTIEGLADELGPAQIAITVNGVEVYRGDSGFASWDPSAATPAWTPVSYPIPAGVLQAGANEITVANLAESAAFGLPPYILLSVASLAFDA